MKKSLFILILFICHNSFSQAKSLEKKISEPIESKEDINEISLSVIENVPIYKGCDKTKSNSEIRTCMSNKIKEHVSKNFNVSIAHALGIKGKQRIIAAFKINKKGRVIDVNARASHPALEKEAIRIVNLIPKMDSPGIQKGKPVIVPYSLPITFEVTGDFKTEDLNKNISFPVFRGCYKDLTYEDQKKCTTEKIINFIKLSFDYETANKALPLEKSTQFTVKFIINKKGKVEQINATAQHRAIAIDVIKLIKRLPKFKSPGKEDNEPVDTPINILMTVYLY